MFKKKVTVKKNGKVVAKKTTKVDKKGKITQFSAGMKK